MRIGVAVEHARDVVFVKGGPGAVLAVAVGFLRAFAIPFHAGENGGHGGGVADAWQFWHAFGDVGGGVDVDVGGAVETVFDGGAAIADGDGDIGSDEDVVSVLAGGDFGSGSAGTGVLPDAAFVMELGSLVVVGGGAPEVELQWGAEERLLAGLQ